MPEQIAEGTIIRNKANPSQRMIRRGNQWVPMPPEDSGMTPLGQGYVQNEAGGVFKEGTRGGLHQVGGPPQIGSEAGTRVGIAPSPMIEAQQQMDRSERAVGSQPGLALQFDQSGRPKKAQRGNPIDEDWGAAWLDSLDDSQPARWLGFDTGALARTVGGQDYQSYDQAARTYESAMLPIFSGAAVSPSEAQRLIRADLPQRGDSAETLAKKARNRAMRINWAARQMSQKAPFTVPEDGSPRPVTGFGAGDGSALKDKRPRAKAATAPAKPDASPYRVLSVE